MDYQALAQEYVRLRLQWAFGIPGGGPSLQLIDAMMRAGVSFITTGHETTAALMAGAVSRVSGVPSAAITIKGPGFMNLVPGLLSNAYEGYPMLSVSETYAPGVAGIRRHKWLAHAQVFGSFGKAFGYWDGTADLVGRCWRRAISEFPGPVHLELADGPCIEPEEETDVPDDPSVVTACIQRAERPVLVVGSVALRAPWRRFLPQVQVPIFTTVAAKGVISELSRYAAGVYTGDGKPVTPEKKLLPAADLIVAIGVRSGEVLSPGFPDAECIRLDTAAVRSRGVFPPGNTEGVRHLSDPGFNEVFQELLRKSWGEDEIVDAYGAMENALRPRGWSPVRIYGVVAGALPHAIHVLDTGNFTVVGEHMLRVKVEQEVFGTPNGRYMGFGIGYALGAAIASGNRPVVLWIGDGGIRAFFSELSLAVEQRLKLLVLVMSDGYFGSIGGRAEVQGWCTEPLRMQGRDLRRIAEAMGMDALAVENDESLVGVLEAWRANPQPMLIRCDFDTEEYANVAEILR